MTTFVTVVETEGFASAARKLNVSPSVISRVMTELEEYLGVRLLTRTTRVVRITDAGASFYEDCRRILADIDAAELSATGTGNTPRGQLTVTAPVLFGKSYVTPIALEYLQQHPSVNLNCWFLDRVVNLVDEGADVAVRIGEVPNSSGSARFEDRSGTSSRAPRPALAVRRDRSGKPWSRPASGSRTGRRSRSCGRGSTGRSVRRRRDS